MLSRYRRSDPSPRYRELMALYAEMHARGEARLGLPPEKTFPGSSLFPHLARIKRLVEATGAKTILDYGAGKGLQYRPQKIVVDGVHVADGVAEYWDVDEVTCYDPGYGPHAGRPEGSFDGVICTDVLEHCPEEDLDWILEDIFGYARRFVYLNVACYPARKTLPNGENAHITVRPPAWWQEKAAAAARPEVRFELHADTREEPQSAGITEVDVDGRKARFRTPNAATLWRARTLFEKEPTTVAWLRAMPQGALFLDAGANVGMYTVLAALLRGARVTAFEPESANYALLNENLRLNALGAQVLAFCAGLSDRAGLGRLYLSQTLAGGSCHSLDEEVGFDLKPRPAAFAQGAVALRLDDLVEAGDIPAPEYVKIDVDGFEHKVLRGMARTLRRGTVRSLLVELNPALAEHREARAFLAELGYAWDAAQVAAAARTSGPFAGVAEHVFRR